MNPEEETVIRSGLSAAAQRVTASLDLLDRVVAARSRHRRHAATLTVAATSVAVAAVAITVAVSARNAEPIAAPARQVSPSGIAADCPASFAPGSLPLFNTWRGPGRVDPHPTEVIACRYSAASGNPMTWRLLRSTTLTGTTAASLARWLNAAPAADPRKRCPSTTQEEVWSLRAGTSKTALIEVQLNGCGFASDGHQVVQWQRPGVLGSAK
ncbi:MAG: hypothetical protein JWR24_1283 [Actinoallomurus sp.]|jgi:hypothetical protein|nr:hypothetical protein [Actinoallomurus sp.]